jgi:lysine-N-methylase
MDGTQLPVVMPAVPDQHWDCHSCTRCCRKLVVHLLDEDRRRIDECVRADQLGAAPYVRFDRKWVLNKREDEACVFLQEDGRCRLHAEHGVEAKPLACRLYPFTLSAFGGKWLAAWRFDCPSVARSQGRGITSHRKTLSKLRSRIPQRVSSPDESIDLKRNRPAVDRELEALLDHLRRWLCDERRPLPERLAGATSLVETLRAANLAVVQDERFVELVELVASDLPSAVAEEPKERPTHRRQALFRQLVFAHTEHLTLQEIRSRRTRFTRRFRQLRMSRQFRRGVGRVPPLPDLDADVSFDEVNRIRPADADADDVASVVSRFVRTRLLSRYQFGPLYYGWPVLDGLRALWASVAVLGWLARHGTAVRGGVCVATEDVIGGLASVDGAIGRSPSLGTAAERMRLEYLARDGGIVRLLHAYRLVNSQGSDEPPGGGS